MSKVVQSIFSNPLLAQNDDALLNFCEIIQSAHPASKKQIAALPKKTRELSMLLTSAREKRKLFYMSEKPFLFSYAHYFMWWNLIRLSRVFSSLDFSFLKDGDLCIDIGSGPLTAVIALWICRPDLRKKKLIWRALDISQQALIFGEKIFLKVAQKTSPQIPAWKIVRAKSAFGAPAKEKSSLAICANVFNEILDGQNPFGVRFASEAKKIAQKISACLKDDGAVFLAEPGVPAWARFISLMRSEFLKNSFSILAPCPHEKKCPMENAGKKGAKWCNFAFDAKDAPNALLALSKKAGLPKDRAAISFLFAKKATKKNAAKCEEFFRIVSDEIRLEKNERGYYACSQSGFSLLKVESKIRARSGDLIEKAAATNERDKKTGAPIWKI